MRMASSTAGQKSPGLLAGVADLRGLPGLTPQLEQTMTREFLFAPYAVRNAEFVGPKVGATLRRQALYATLYALTGMLIYIAFRFEFVYGVAAVIATLHDVIITIGCLSLFNIEVSLTVVAALLTLVGFSVNDSIVVFDRIRENLKLMRREGLVQVVKPEHQPNPKPDHLDLRFNFYYSAFLVLVRRGRVAWLRVCTGHRRLSWDLLFHRHRRTDRGGLAAMA